MSQRSILVLIIVLLVIGGGILVWYMVRDDTADSTNQVVQDTNSAVSAVKDIPQRPPENTVWVLDASFNPSVVTISAGDSVTWVNKDDLNRQPASDPHPAHTNVPGFESTPLPLDGTYTFIFDEVGEWYYHDHLNPISKGKIVVE